MTSSQKSRHYRPPNYSMNSIDEISDNDEGLKTRSLVKVPNNTRLIDNTTFQSDFSKLQSTTMSHQNFINIVENTNKEPRKNGKVMDIEKYQDATIDSDDRGDSTLSEVKE